jgi:hypothetical protein
VRSAQSMGRLGDVPARNVSGSPPGTEELGLALDEVEELVRGSVCGALPRRAGVTGEYIKRAASRCELRATDDFRVSGSAARASTSLASTVRSLLLECIIRVQGVEADGSEAESVCGRFALLVRATEPVRASARSSPRPRWYGRLGTKGTPRSTESSNACWRRSISCEHSVLTHRPGLTPEQLAAKSDVQSSLKRLNAAYVLATADGTRLDETELLLGHPSREDQAASAELEIAREIARRESQSVWALIGHGLKRHL